MFIFPELAIAANLCIPYYLKEELPFVGPILISTIQLGATVDYAILMTTKYRRERMSGTEKKEAVALAVDASAKSILVSALAFFAATFGVGLYSNIDMISSLCSLMARGALISMVVVLLLLPSAFYLLDPLIMATTRREGSGGGKLRAKLGRGRQERRAAEESGEDAGAKE